MRPEGERAETVEREVEGAHGSTALARRVADGQRRRQRDAVTSVLRDSQRKGRGRPS